MKKEVDFIAEFEKENSELKQEETNPSPPTEEEYRKMRLGMKLVDLKKAQYQKTKNEQLWNLWTNTFYQMMCDTARIQGGRVTLKIDEENLTGSLIYFGHDILINSYARNQKCFADMMEKAQEVFIDSIDGLLKITFLFHVYDKTRLCHNKQLINSHFYRGVSELPYKLLFAVIYTHLEFRYEVSHTITSHHVHHFHQTRIPDGTLLDYMVQYRKPLFPQFFLYPKKFLPGNNPHHKEFHLRPYIQNNANQ